MDDNSVDAVVTDPPYGLSKEPDINEVLTKWLAGEPYDHNHGGFMGKAWDSFVPHPDIWREVFRVLKPGGHALVFAGTRTQDLMTVSLRMAGFEVRDVIEFLYMTGFPKGHNVSKTFESRGNSELAERYKGFNTNLKPAHEPIIMVRKPLHDGRKMTVVDCVEKYGTGAINIDACRIGNEKRENAQKDFSAIHGNQYGNGAYQPTTGSKVVEGRFPANCITLDSDQFYSKYFNVANITPADLSKKASKKDRNSDWRGREIGLEEAPTGHGNLQNSKGFERFNTFNRNNHPTVKPTDLMAWLVRLSTPPNGVVLDPFAGSGSTLVAAKREGFGFIGIEREPEYVEIIEARTHVKAIKGEGEAE